VEFYPQEVNLTRILIIRELAENSVAITPSLSKPGKRPFMGVLSIRAVPDILLKTVAIRGLAVIWDRLTAEAAPV
jgi:hypothetical protein